MTPDLPFVVFITAGFVAASLLGNWPFVLALVITDGNPGLHRALDTV